MASLLEDSKIKNGKYRKEDQDWKEIDALFLRLEMAVCAYVETLQQDDWEEEEEAIFDEQVTLSGKEKEKEEKEKGTLRLAKTTKKKKNKVKSGCYVRKQQKGGKQKKIRQTERQGGKKGQEKKKGGKQKKIRQTERQGGKKGQEKNKQGRKEGVISLNDEEQEKEQILFRDNG